ncbi:hypothetical protein FRC07_002782 [Ceratobasidium sp. 392]|nr:hypothetical protein FRC07_002782 [Ceratobasidium sp. 392]
MAELAAKMETALAKLTQRDGQELTESDPVWGETSWSFAFYGEVAVVHDVSHVIKILRQLNRTRYTLNGLAELIISYSLSSPFHSSHPTDSQAAPSSTETRQIPLPPSGASLTFHEARTVLAAFSGEASRTSELIKEWVAACTVEVPAWDEIKVEMVASDDEYDLETL